VNGVLERDNIILRKVSPFKKKTGLFRITIGDKEENERCVEAVKAFFNSRR
jgi:histidinol-phosphate/aromatic aminotransferase/cobyric acid decarboxylase-like protein